MSGAEEEYADFDREFRHRQLARRLIAERARRAEAEARPGD